MPTMHLSIEPTKSRKRSLFNGTLIGLSMTGKRKIVENMSFKERELAFCNGVNL
jgi:hypothetical protein